MRGVNIHVDFVMIQCTKKTYALSHPLCHPAIGGVRITFIPDPGFRPSGYTPGSLPYAASPYGEALKFRSPTAPGFAEACAICPIN